MGKASENLFWKALKQHINNEKNPKDINGRIKELAKKITLLGSRQALELLEDENNRNFYYKIYKAAVGYINNREMKLSKEYNMGKETCEKIISFYNYLLPSRDNERSRAMSWFCNKVIFNECDDRSEDKSIITITPEGD